MIRATRSRSSRPNPLKDQGDSCKVLRRADFRRFPGDLHSVAKQALFETSFFCVPGRFWSDLGRFWEVKMAVKIDFGVVFKICSRFFSITFWHRFGVVFWKAEFVKIILKTIGFSMVLANFHKIDVFKTSTPQNQFWLHFGMPQTIKNR